MVRGYIFLGADIYCERNSVPKPVSDKLKGCILWRNVVNLKFKFSVESILVLFLYRVFMLIEVNNYHLRFCLILRQFMPFWTSTQLGLNHSEFGPLKSCQEIFCFISLFRWMFGSLWLILLLFLFCSPVVNGHIKRPHDEDIQSNVLEIVGSNIQSTYITCPADPAATLGIKLPFLVMIVKNVKKYFTFEIQVLDDKNVRRRFRASNFQVCKLACVYWYHFPDGFPLFHFFFPLFLVIYYFIMCHETSRPK